MCVVTPSLITLRFMTRFIRLWNSPQGGSFNFRSPCKNLIMIQLIATNSICHDLCTLRHWWKTSWDKRQILFVSQCDLARISKPAWKWRVRREKHLQSLDPRLPNKGNLVRRISDQMVLPTDIIHGRSKFYAFYVEMMFGTSRADYL